MSRGQTLFGTKTTLPLSQVITSLCGASSTGGRALSEPEAERALGMIAAFAPGWLTQRDRMGTQWVKLDRQMRLGAVRRLIKARAAEEDAKLERAEP